MDINKFQPFFVGIIFLVSQPTPSSLSRLLEMLKTYPCPPASPFQRGTEGDLTSVGFLQKHSGGGETR
jgi:hypothetical protein